MEIQSNNRETSDKIKEATNLKDYAWAKDWESPFAHHAGELHQLGEIEMQQLGARYRKRFPALLGHSYNPSRYKFVSSQVGALQTLICIVGGARLPFGSALIPSILACLYHGFLLTSFKRSPLQTNLPAMLWSS